MHGEQVAHHVERAHCRDPRAQQHRSRAVEARELVDLHALDERLRKLLTATGVRVWESGPDDAFWDFGYPRNAGPDLVEDLRSEKLLL